METGFRVKLAKLSTITGADWRVAIARARAEKNSASEQIQAARRAMQPGPEAKCLGLQPENNQCKRHGYLFGA